MSDTSRPPPTAQGTLGTTSPAQVFAHALDRQLSGTLELDLEGSWRATVVMKEGWPCKARTNEPHYLGMVLHTLGIIDDTKLNASLARLAQERRPHGRILRDMGAIGEDSLLLGLRTQLAGKIEPLFGLPPTTQYQFFEGFDALGSWGGPEIALLDPLPLLWSALQGAPPWAHVDALLARVEHEQQMRVVPRVDLARLRFMPRVQNLVDRMRQTPLTLDGMVATGQVDSNGARLLVYCLLILKQLSFSGPENFRSASSALRPSAPPPPRVSVSAPAPLPAAEPSRPSPSVPPPARLSTPPPGVALTPELASMRQRIIDRVATIADEDYFEILQLPHDASVAVAQQTYLTLAKSWHPDRLAPQLFDVRDLCGKIFGRMTEARNVLTDPEKRASYVALLKKGVRGQAPTRSTNASFEFQKAEVFLKKRDLAQAAEHARRAHEVDPANADYLTLLTSIAIEQDGAKQGNAHKHLDALERALKMDERCERAYMCRANLYKRLNKPERAYLDFKSASDLNPKNIDAAREVRLYRKRST